MSDPVLLSKEHLTSLKKGDTFTTEGLFITLTKEPIVWTLKAVDSGGEYLFRIEYLGVKLGNVHAMIKKNGQVEVEEVS